MRRLLFRLAAACVTFVIGIGCTFAITRKFSRWLDLFPGVPYRSCQIKRIGADGHAVWTPCEMSAHREARELPAWFR